LKSPRSSFEILPHSLAPLFSESYVRNPRTLIEKIRTDLESGRVSASEMFIALIRQAGLVSLFFFLSRIASFSGPYEKLNESLHLDMANFRQSPASMAPSARAAEIVTRGFYKSTICAHGADSWEIVRDPNIRIRLVSSIVERAHTFKNISRSTFDSNAFFAMIYPEYVPSKSTPRWNETEFVAPNRTRNYAEPTMSAGGATGASEGIHVDLLDVDDIEGLEDLDVQHRAAATMFQKKKWFATNSTALLVDLTSRINLKGTFYGGDDVHSAIMNDARDIQGYLDPEFAPTQNGVWTVYYRCWLEDDREVFPQVMNKDRYAKLLSEDPWTAITQYGNKPHDPSVSEFYKYETKRCSLMWSPKRGEFFIRKGQLQENELSNWEDDIPLSLIRLGSLSIGMFVDPAGTDRGISSKASRTAIEIIGLDAEENAYLLWSRVGYFSVHTMFDYIFDGCKKFEGLVSLVGVESNAMQKMIAPLLEKERSLRGYYINPVPIMASGDKEARIRVNVGRALMRGQVWIVEGEETAFEEERMLFPGNEFKRDALDAFEKGLTYLTKPTSQEDIDESELEEEAYWNEPTRDRLTGM
jgi:hypothetical protein